MIIEDAFIPCAGKGTRMGSLGHELAKPLWPVFDKTLLELQVEILKKLKCNNFIINTHHLHDQIEDKTRSINTNIKIANETKLLGSGGCFHNLKVLEESLEKMISLNSDIQILMSDKDEALLKKTFLNNDYVLVCLPVKKGGTYNEVCFNKDNFFTEVRPPNAQNDYVTYSGFGMINISKLEYVAGESSFFDTVINKKLNKAKIFVPSDPYEYWDWGTRDLYLDNIKQLSNSNHKSQLKTFLTDCGALDVKELGEDSYRSSVEGIYNFSSLNISDQRQKGIYFNIKEKPRLLAL